MTIKVTYAKDEEDALEKVENQYKGMDVIFLQKKQKDQSEDYIYYFDVVDCVFDAYFIEEEKDNE